MQEVDGCVEDSKRVLVLHSDEKVKRLKSQKHMQSYSLVERQTDLQKMPS